MSEIEEKEALRVVAQKSPLDQILGVEVSGNVPQLKRRERGQLLGQFRERVLWGATRKAIDRKGMQSGYLLALVDSRASKLLVRSDATLLAMPYVLKAAAKGIEYTFIQSAEFFGDVVIVLASSDAVDDIKDPIVEH